MIPFQSLLLLLFTPANNTKNTFRFIILRCFQTRGTCQKIKFDISNILNLVEIHWFSSPLRIMFVLPYHKVTLIQFPGFASILLLRVIRVPQSGRKLLFCIFSPPGLQLPCCLLQDQVLIIPSIAGASLSCIQSVIGELKKKKKNFCYISVYNL